MSNSLTYIVASYDVCAVLLAVTMVKEYLDFRIVSFSSGVGSLLLIQVHWRTGVDNKFLPITVHCRSTRNSSSDWWLEERMPHVLVRSKNSVHILVQFTSCSPHLLFVVLSPTINVVEHGSVWAALNLHSCLHNIKWGPFPFSMKDQLSMWGPMWISPCLSFGSLLVFNIDHTAPADLPPSVNTTFTACVLGIPRAIVPELFFVSSPATPECK